MGGGSAGSEWYQQYNCLSDIDTRTRLTHRVLTHVALQGSSHSLTTTVRTEVTCLSHDMHSLCLVGPSSPPDCAGVPGVPPGVGVRLPLPAMSTEGKRHTVDA